MGWYDNIPKIDFGERNVLNKKIRNLYSISDQVIKLSKFVFQSARGAREQNLQLINDKFLSSYPSIREVLMDADIIALDNPWKFALLLKEAKDRITVKIGELKQERENLMKSKDPSNKYKGWV